VNDSQPRCACDRGLFHIGLAVQLYRYIDRPNYRQNINSASWGAESRTCLIPVHPTIVRLLVIVGPRSPLPGQSVLTDSSGPLGG
jgi:hypothetical protein